MTFTLVQAIPYAIAIFMLGFFFGIIAKVFKEQSPTRDYVDWSKIPEGYDWVAAESSGRVFLWNAEPEIMGDGWNTGDGTLYTEGRNFITGHIPPWRESLRRRPQ